MPDPDLTGISDGPPIFPTDRYINDTTRTVNELKRLMQWKYQSEYRKRDELSFVAFHKTDVSSGGGTINLHLSNPTDSGISLDVQNITVTAQFLGEYEIFDEFSTEPSGGSDAGIDNVLMDTSGGGADVGTANANVDVSFTSSGTHFGETMPSGGSAGNPVGGQGEATKPLIEPGREIVVELTNESTNTRSGSIGVSWVEEDTVYTEL